jgi:hypothetical protein
MDLHESVVNKLNDFGHFVNSDRKIDDREEYYIAIDSAVFFVNNETNIVKISYLASTKPEDAASMLLVIQEIEEVDKIIIMESFMFNEEKKVVSGLEAHQQVLKNICDRAIREFATSQIQAKMLEEWNPKNASVC